MRNRLLELEALRAISKVLDRNIVNAADRLFAGFELSGNQYSLEEQILVATIEDGMDPSSCATLNPDGLSEDTRRSLFMSALLETEPDWIQLLSGTDMDTEWIQAAQSAIARKMFEKGQTGEQVFETLRAMSGDDDARNKLGEMLLAGEVPATEAYTVARDTSNADALAKTAKEYIRKATWETNRPEVYVEISHLADSGVVDESAVSNEIKRSKLSDNKEKLLSLIYLCGDFDKYLEEINRAEKEIQKGNFRLGSEEFQWLYCNALWEFWGKDTEKCIIEYSLKVGPNNLNSDVWCNDSIQKSGELFLNRLEKGELQFRREVFCFSNVEAEATNIIVSAINNLIKCRREKRASSLICVWEIEKSDIDTVSRQLKIEISKRIRESALRGNIENARDISNRWNMGGVKETIKGSQSKVDPIVMAKGYKNDIFNKKDIEEWFSKEVEEDLNNALGILRADVNSELRNVATVKVLEAIESSEYLKAGRLISAFGLQNEFGPEITKILPALVESRKTGIIKNLLGGVGKSVASSFSDLIFDKCKEYVEDGNPKDAMIIVEKSGVSYMAEEFYDWLSNKVKEATINVEYDFLLSILDERRSWDKLDAEALVRASSIVNYEVELKVLKVLLEDGYAFANLPEKAGRVFVHASNLDFEFHTLERGEYIYATVELGDDGPKAVQASRTPQQSEALHRL